MDNQAAKLKEIMAAKKENQPRNEFQIANTRTIAVASGKGGVGKSTFTVNFAYNLSKLGKKVLIIDNDIGMANLDIMLGVQPNYDLGHFLRGECSLEEALVEAPSGIKLLSGITGDDSFINTQNNTVERLLELGEQIDGNYDFLLIDLGAGAAKSIINTILAVEELILLLTTEPTSVMDSYSLIKILAKHHYDKSIKLVINQPEGQKDAQKTANRIIRTVNDYLKLDLTMIGSIAQDRKISEALRKQKPYSQIFSKRAAARDLEKITRKILGQEKKGKRNSVKSYFQKMLGFFS